MKFTRRGILAAFGIGTVAGPVAAPAFGKALLHQKTMAGIAGVGGYYDEVTQLDSTGPINKTLPANLISQALENNAQVAKDRLNMFHRHAEFMFNRPSWSPAFQDYVKRQELEKRVNELKSIRQKIDDIVMNWWKEHGEETGEKVQASYRDREAQGSVGGTSRYR